MDENRKNNKWIPGFIGPGVRYKINCTKKNVLTQSNSPERVILYRRKKNVTKKK